MQRIRSLTLVRADVTVGHGIRVTMPARTLADIAPRLSDPQLIRAIHEARRNGDLPPAQLQRLLDGCSRARRLVDPGQPASESALDDAFRALLRRFRLPVPELQADFHGHRVDAIYRRERLIIELDGARDHRQWDRIERDHLRDALALQHGFVTLRITWRMIREQPRRLARQLRSILAQRGR